mgnify:CR=1 FL=1
MNQEQALSLLKETKLVAILRGIPVKQATDIATALYDGGVRVLEFTFDHDDPDCVAHNCQRIRAVKKIFGDEMVVGCGTALTVQEVEASVEAGGQIVISPNVDVSVIAKTKALGAISMPGALTPTEILTAHQNGADFVKVFPAGCLGAGYIKAIRGPINHVPLLAVGGVSEKNAGEFMKAGCAGIGAGGNLVNKQWIEAGEFDKITALAKEFIRALAE